MHQKTQITGLSDEELERALRAKRAARITALLLVAPLFITAFVSLVAALNGTPLFFVPAALALAGAVFCILYMIGAKSAMKQLLSANIVQGALSAVFAGCQYNYEGRLPSSVIKEARLISGWTDISGSDLVVGRYRGRGVEFSDIKLERVTQVQTGESTSQRRETLFRGQWLVFELGRVLPASVRVIEKEGRGGLRAALKNLAKSDVETENAAFNAQFRIETVDPHTAFYVLTPHFIEYIMAADAAARARTCLCFTGGRVHIALDNGRDSFELGRAADLKDIAALRARVRREIKYLTGILDVLMQNKYLFEKEN
ncbi:MAG: DUF3137 domain-containing protein [Firmicutes bacterium]|nr:DUF3137 domain-containing protein [Bacillota bacterium]